MSNSPDTKMFRDAARDIEEREKAEDNKPPVKERRADRVRSKRRQERKEKLDKLIPNRRCPLCDELKVESRCWVIFNAEQMALLNACVAMAIDKVAAGLALKAKVVCRSCCQTYWRGRLWSTAAPGKPKSEHT